VRGRRQGAGGGSTGLAALLRGAPLDQRQFAASVVVYPGRPHLVANRGHAPQDVATAPRVRPGNNQPVVTIGVAAKNEGVVVVVQWSGLRRCRRPRPCGRPRRRHKGLSSWALRQAASQQCPSTHGGSSPPRAARPRSGCLPRRRPIPRRPLQPRRLTALMRTTMPVQQSRSRGRRKGPSGTHRRGVRCPPLRAEPAQRPRLSSYWSGVASRGSGVNPR
jgi:hypothetical protein